jgi:hypothetical protein
MREAVEVSRLCKSRMATNNSTSVNAWKICVVNMRRSAGKVLSETISNWSHKTPE